MFFQYLKALDKGDSKYGTMRVGGRTQEICDAKVANYLASGWELASNEDVIADRGALISDTPEGLADMEAAEAANGDGGFTPEAPVADASTDELEAAPEVDETDEQE
jgi:hypothetical protein